MPQYKLTFFRYPLFALCVAFVISSSLVALLIAYAGTLPIRAFAPVEAPKAPLDQGLEIENQVQDKVLVYKWMTYTMAFTNTSGQLLENVCITDTWATNAVEPNDPPPAEYNGNLSDPQGVVDSYTWTVGTEAGAMYIYVGTLNPGVSARLVFTMGVPDDLEPNYNNPEIGPSILGNSVDIGTSTPGVDNANDTDTTLIVGPVLKLEKTVETETSLANKERPGRLVTYTLSLRNLNEAEDGRNDEWPATQVKVWEDIPDNLTLVDVQAPVMWTYISSSNRISWTLLGALDPGDTTYLTFTARVTTTGWDFNIDNEKEDCQTISAERLTPVKCKDRVRLNVLSPLEKEVETKNPPSGDNKTYPNRIITYTVHIYNPLQIPVSDLRVTDTLPSEFFTYVDMVDGPSPTGSPTNTIVWDGLSLPANGVISFTFRVFVDPHTPVDLRRCWDKTYDNTLAADSPAFPVVYEDHSFLSDPVQVTLQIKLSKTVTPDEQLPGEQVTYTIQIQNLGNTSMNIPILTDTLPIYFRYHSMVAGPPPGEPAGEVDNVIWWDDLPTIGPGETFEFSFQATVDGDILEEYGNEVSGFSPATFICSIDDKARVRVLTPILYTKVAIPPYPTPVVQGEEFDYAFACFNQSSLQSYTIDQFWDDLPDGFEKDGNNIYTFDISPPFELEPDTGSTWEHQFSVQVVGEGAGTDWCNDLADEGNRQISQELGTFAVRTVTPLAYWLNAFVAAPMYVKPHVDLLHEYYPSKVGLSGTMTVTLALSNNLRSPAQPVNNITLTYELERDFAYLGVVPGTPEPDIVADELLVWTGIDLPASGIIVYNFWLQAPFAPDNYNYVKAYAVAADPDICIPEAKRVINVVKGVTLSKTPSPDEIGPFGTVEYTLKATNETNAPASGVRITDTLPFGFEFIEMTSAHTPVSLSPLVWEIPYIEPLSTEEIKFKVRAYVNLGPQYNWIHGIGASTYVTLEKTIQGYMDHVKLNVLPGVGLYKIVEPQELQAGQPVTYTINLYNGSDKKMANIILTDTLPSGFSYDEMVDGPAPSIITGSLVIWEIDSLNKEDTLRLVFHANTDEDAFSDTYYNQVSGEAWDASSPYGAIDIPSTDLTAPVVVHGLPLVQRSKSVSPSSVRAGNLVTYTITLYNEMTDPQTLRLTDTLPLSLTFDSVVGTTPTPVQISPVVWENIEIDSQQTVTLVFRAWVDLYARSGDYENQIDVATEFYEFPTKYLAPLQVEEIPRYDLQITKSDGKVTVNEGELLEYTIIYTNANNAGLTLTNVVITDTFSPLPPFVTPLGVGGEWVQVAVNVYTHAVGNLGAGESGSVQFRLQLSDTIPAEIMIISNTVKIGHDTGELAFESDLDNNCFTDLDILRGPDLVITSLDVSPDSPQAGDPITFSVTVHNQGKDDVVNAANSTWFLVELYLKGSSFTPSGPPADVFDHVGGWWSDEAHSLERMPYMCVPAGLAAGDEVICTFVITDVVDADDYYVHVQADVTFNYLDEPWGHDYGAVLEVIETNNIVSFSPIHVGGNYIYLPIITKSH